MTYLSSYLMPLKNNLNIFFHFYFIIDNQLDTHFNIEFNLNWFKIIKYYMIKN